MAVVTLTAGCTGTSDPPTAGTDLPDGFEVPAGTRIIGAVIPMLAQATGPQDPDGTRAHGWQVLLRTSGEPEKIYEAFRAQVKPDLPTFSPPASACREDERGTRCSGAWSRGAFGTYLNVIVGDSLAWISYTELSSPAETTTRDIADTYEGAPPRINWWEVPGTRRMIGSESFGCNGGRFEILEVTGDPGEVWESLVQRAGWTETRTERRAHVGG